MQSLNRRTLLAATAAMAITPQRSPMLASEGFSFRMIGWPSEVELSPENVELVLNAMRAKQVEDFFEDDVREAMARNRSVT